jgi:branched-chain amino acid transport system ATP-binding protein
MRTRPSRSSRACASVWTPRPTISRAFDAFDKLRHEVSIIIVEHNLDLVLALADRAYVLERGTVVHEGPAHPLLKDLDLRRQVLWL